MVAFSALFGWAINGLNGAANWMVRRLGIEPAEELASARSPQELASPRTDLGAARVAGPRYRDPRRPLPAFRRTHGRGSDDPACTGHGARAEDTVDELLRARRYRASRFPVCRDGDLDNLVGVVHVKQAFVPTRNCAPRAWTR